MISYFDTSALVPLLVVELATAEAQQLWGDSDRVATVRLAIVETSAAIAQAARLARLTTAQHAEAKRQASHLFSVIDLVEIDAALVDHAAQLAELHSLRGCDAMHLSSALAMNDDELVFVAGDRALLRAASAAGLTTVGVSDD